MPTDEELQAHCYSCHDFSNSQTVLMKGRCPWNAPTEFAYLVALTDLKKTTEKTKTKQKTQTNKTKTELKPKQNPGLQLQICTLYTYATYPSLEIFIKKAHRPKYYLLTPTQSPYIWVVFWSNLSEWRICSFIHKEFQIAVNFDSLFLLPMYRHHHN